MAKCYYCNKTTDKFKTRLVEKWKSKKLIESNNRICCYKCEIKGYSDYIIEACCNLNVDLETVMELLGGQDIVIKGFSPPEIPKWVREQWEEK